MRCLRRLLNISYRDRITNIEIRNRVTKEIGPHSELLAMVIAKKLRWFGHVIRSNSMSKTILHGSIEGKRRRGKPKMQWQDNIVKWTGLDINKAMRAAENREFSLRMEKNGEEIYLAHTASKCYGIGKRIKINNIYRYKTPVKHRNSRTIFNRFSLSVRNPYLYTTDIVTISLFIIWRFLYI